MPRCIELSQLNRISPSVIHFKVLLYADLITFLKESCQPAVFYCSITFNYQFATDCISIACVDLLDFIIFVCSVPRFEDSIKILENVILAVITFK